MILDTSSLTQQKVVNYSVSSLADRTDASQSKVTKAELEYLHLYNNMTIIRRIILIYVATGFKCS